MNYLVHFSDRTNFTGYCHWRKVNAASISDAVHTALASSRAFHRFIARKVITVLVAEDIEWNRRHSDGKPLSMTRCSVRTKEAS